MADTMHEKVTVQHEKYFLFSCLGSSIQQVKVRTWRKFLFMEFLTEIKICTLKLILQIAPFSKISERLRLKNHKTNLEEMTLITVY